LSLSGVLTNPQAALKKKRFVFAHARWEKFVAGLVAFLLAITGLATFYRFGVAHRPHVRRRAWAGALVAMVAWIVISWAFGAYVGSLGQYALFYGSLAAVAVLLFWLYLSSFALLIGAELNAQLEGVRDR
jgi:membrane protein